jgi:hypothetical protein
MDTYEKIEELKTIELKLEKAKDTYFEAEKALVDLVGEYVLGAEISSKLYGTGHIISYYGPRFDEIVVEIEFADTAKKISLMHIITTGNFYNFTDTLEIGVIWNDAYLVHTELTRQLRDLDRLSEQLKVEAEKKAEEDKKAEEAYQRRKSKALRDFAELTQRTMPTNETEDFYYSLGWLAKYSSAINAVLPDYLEDAFKRHFGTEVPCRVIDSKKKSPGGWTQQWSWSFTASLKKPENIPVLLSEYLSSTGKAIVSTSFIWDLVDHYGFQFGKKQNLDKIRSCIPSDYVSFFEAGLA